MNYYSRQQSPLNNDEMIRRAPSIFSAISSENTSDKYKLIPTIEAVNVLRSQGWEPIMAAEQRVRAEHRKGFQKHIIRFRQQGQNTLMVGDSLVEIVLTNSHDGLSAYTLHAGLFRLVCSNGLVIADATFQKLSIVHKGYEPTQFVAASQSVLDSLPQIKGSVEAMQKIELSGVERELFAKTALTLRYDEGKSPIEAPRLLASRRYNDEGKDLWSTFNTVQENLVRGGQRGRNANGGRSSTREVGGIDSNIKLNKALWSLADEMRKIKEAA